MKSIVVNIGNSNIRFGLFLQDQCELSWVITTKPYRSKDEIYAQVLNLYHTYDIRFSEIKKVVVGSVVPQLTKDMLGALKKIHGVEPILVDRNVKTPVSHKSNQMGTDIYANLVAAHFLYPNQNVLIVDFGTALTVSCVDKAGVVLGAIIAPGIITALNSLVKGTAQLPEIVLEKPDSVLGIDTESCMKSGMVYGYLGMVEGFIDRIGVETGLETTVVATGGVSHVYQPLTNKIHVMDRFHTLKGLYILAEQKQNQK